MSMTILPRARALCLTLLAACALALPACEILPTTTTRTTNPTPLPGQRDTLPAPRPTEPAPSTRLPRESNQAGPRLLFVIAGDNINNIGAVRQALRDTGLEQRGAYAAQIASLLQGRENFPDRINTDAYLDRVPKVVDRVLDRWRGTRLERIFWDYEPREGRNHWLDSDRFTPADAAFVQRVQRAIRMHLAREGLNYPVAMYGPVIPSAAGGPNDDAERQLSEIRPMLAGWDWTTVVLYPRVELDLQQRTGRTSAAALERRVEGWLDYYRRAAPHAEAVPFIKLLRQERPISADAARKLVAESVAAGARDIVIWFDASNPKFARENARAVNELAPAIIQGLSDAR